MLYAISQKYQVRHMAGRQRASKKVNSNVVVRRATGSIRWIASTLANSVSSGAHHLARQTDPVALIRLAIGRRSIDSLCLE
ncbi:hypothetical protein QMZ05_39280 [Bradyrhizobium sp. INPA03-11B]|uniref:hypothetical protein n=1 Tax=Bradyrhizobium sp. INPA03-11B TaxID=418598 RepID=UPI00338E0A00